MNTNQNNKYSKLSIWEIAISAFMLAICLFLGKVAFDGLVGESNPACVAKSVLAVEGDTLWDMVEGNCPDHSRTGETVSIVIRMNHGSDVRPGQIVWFPAPLDASCVEYSAPPLSGVSACSSK